MDKAIIFTLSLGIFLAGLIGTTLSLPLQSPSLILIGIAGFLAVFVVLRRGLAIPHPWLFSAVVIATFYFLIRSVMSPVVDLAFEDQFLIIAAALVYFIAGYIVSNPGMRLSLALTLLLLLLLHLGSTVMQLNGNVGYSALNFFVPDFTTPEGPVKGMYRYYGSYANFAAVTGMLSISLGMWGRFRHWLRVLISMIGVLAIVTVVLSSSRSAALSLMVGFFVIVVLLWLSISGQKTIIKRWVGGGLAAFGSLALMGTAIAIYFVFRTRANGATGMDIMFDSVDRFYYWSMAAEQFFDHPLVGAGSRSYAYECFRYWSSNLSGAGKANPEFVHNEYLQVLADYGSLGLLAILIIMGGHLVLGVSRVGSLSRRISDDGLIRGYNAIALCVAGVVGSIIILVHAISDFRTHILSNMQLLVCCTVWVLPARNPLKSVPYNRFLSYAVALMVLLLSTYAISLGIIQLRGGLPLVKDKMLSEAGAWQPESVDRDIWIPNLEESIKRTASYRRHLKLGTLYLMEAQNITGVEQEAMLEKSIQQYLFAASRHPYEPVYMLNIASILTYTKKYEEADAYYKMAYEIASAREYHLKIHLKWSDMHRQWAAYLWHEGDRDDAESHYKLAIGLLEKRGLGGAEAMQMYLRVAIEYARTLDSREAFDTADLIYRNAEKKLPNYMINGLSMNIRREIGEHYLRKGKHLWYKRKPEEAYSALVKAKENFEIHRRALKGQKDQKWEKSNDEVVQILKFFNLTGIKNKGNS